MDDGVLNARSTTRRGFDVVPPPQEKLPVPESSAPQLLVGFDHIVLVYPDLEAAERWYIDVLGAKFLRRIAWGGHQSTHSPHTDVTFGEGDRRIVLSLFHGDPTVLATDGPGLVHFAFRCNDMAELDAWKRHLESKNVPCELMGHLNLGPISVYFSDPWGYRLEITTKVPDWQAAKIELEKRHAGALGDGPLSNFWKPGGTLA